MAKRSILSLLFLGSISMGIVSCGGSGSTESTSINPGDLLSFVMSMGHGTINIRAVTPTSGIVHYLGISTIKGDSISFVSTQATDFYYRPSTQEFGCDFITGNNWHIDPGPVIVDYQMNCSFSATLRQTWSDTSRKSGDMIYSINRFAYNDNGHNLDNIVSISESGQPGTFSIESTGGE